MVVRFLSKGVGRVAGNGFLAFFTECLERKAGRGNPAHQRRQSIPVRRSENETVDFRLNQIESASALG